MVRTQQVRRRQPQEKLGRAPGYAEGLGFLSQHSLGELRL